MPYVNVQITAGAIRQQKAELVREFTSVLARVPGKKPEHTHIVIQEVPEETGKRSVLRRRHCHCRPRNRGLHRR